LGKAGKAGGFGEAAMFDDELEEGEFVKIERDGGEELIHFLHECILLMNFRQLSKGDSVGGVWLIEIRKRNGMWPESIMWM
jgi:hypothetical protein